MTGFPGDDCLLLPVPGPETIGTESPLKRKPKDVPGVRHRWNLL